jgi:hypothetical protein
MDWRRFQEPSFIAAALSCILLFAMLTTRRPMPAPNFQSLHKECTEAMNTTANHIQALEDKIDKLERTLNQIEAVETSIGEVDLPTIKEAEELMTGLGKSPTAEEFAKALATIDNWIVSPDEADSFQQFKTSQVVELRQLVTNEIKVLHERALKADNGTSAAELHAKASQTLALFPMDTAQSVLDEARTLSSKHSEVGARIDALRRQRYNEWAMTQIEAAIKAINAIASSFKTSDNPKTIVTVVNHLGKVDPLLLEPVVAQFYNYAVDQAKNNVNSEQQLELGRRMIDPVIERKGYENF